MRQAIWRPNPEVHERVANDAVDGACRQTICHRVMCDATGCRVNPVQSSPGADINVPPSIFRHAIRFIVRESGRNRILYESRIVRRRIINPCESAQACRYPEPPLAIDEHVTDYACRYRLPCWKGGEAVSGISRHPTSFDSRGKKSHPEIACSVFAKRRDLVRRSESLSLAEQAKAVGRALPFR